MTTIAILAFMNILFIEALSQFNLYDYMLDEQPDPDHCVCVPYWQCKDNNSGLVEDGADIIDIRITRQADIPCTGDFDICCEIKCGRKNNGIVSKISISSRIIGNNDTNNSSNNNAEFGEFPWMLGILQDKVYRCGGSLIHPQMAVTAAHCLSLSETYIVRAGEFNWETKREPLPYQDRVSKKVIIHSLYDPATLRNDIALLLLDKPFRLSKNIGIVCIPSHKQSISNENCIVTGWGKSSRFGTYQSILKKIMLPVVPRSLCTELLKKEALGPYFRLDKSFICAGGDMKDACKGDGGGPLMCPISNEPDRYQQVGIVSWGLTCGIHHAPGVYVNMALFSDWIDKKMTFYNLDTRIYRSNI